MSEQEKDPIAAMLSNRLQLRPLYPNDYGFLYAISVSPDTAFHWRFRGMQPSFDDFIRTLNQGVLVQYVITNRGEDRPLGLVACYKADFINRHAYIAMQGDPILRNFGYLVEAAEMFISFVFRCYGFYKLYAECPGFNFDSFASGLHGVLHEEGVLKEHDEFFERRWDLHVFAIYRSEWLKHEAEASASRSSVQEDQGRGPMCWEEFLSFFCAEMELDTSQVGSTSRLADDLGFDSVQMFEMLGLIRQIGSLIPESALTSCVTIEDIYFNYLQYQG